MPFRSEAQRKFLERELPDIAKRFAADSRSTADLPDRAPLRTPRQKTATSRIQEIAARLVNKPT